MESSTASPAGDTAGITRGAIRLLYDLGYDAITEFSFKTGRRADIIALNRGGEIVIVEVKSSLADFRADSKWQDYLEWCDALFFAVDSDFPSEVLPTDQGWMICDSYGGEIMRDAPRDKIAAPRRKTLTLRFGLIAASRLRGILDEGLDRPSTW